MIKIIFIVIAFIIVSACDPGAKGDRHLSSQNPLIDGRYLNNNDGTVTDIVTNLTWQRCSVGQIWIDSTSFMDETCGNQPSTFNFMDSRSINWLNDYKERKGLNKWRVPTKDELRTLVYCSNTGQYDSNSNDDSCGLKDTFDVPTINMEVFLGEPAFLYWTSTSGDRPSSPKQVSFFNGVSTSDTFPGYVRLVLDNDLGH